jgi:hypothetical protein
MPEFAGTVAAVRTEVFWDREYVSLKVRESALKPDIDKIRAEVKDGTRTRADGDAAIDALLAARFDARELTILRDSVSNQEYHYLGSARILAPIGQAFAESAVALLKGAPARDAVKGAAP